jgi:hypothetical protein
MKAFGLYGNVWLVCLMLMGAMGGAQSPGEEGRAVSKEKRERGVEWYARIRLADLRGERVDRSCVFGELRESRGAYDSHDLPRMLSNYAPYLTGHFPHAEWGRENDLYASDYRRLDRRRRLVWKFTVRSDDANRTIALSVESLELPHSRLHATRQARWITRLQKRLWLQERSTRRYYPLYRQGKAQRYLFVMGAQEKEFRWIYDETSKTRKLYRRQKRAEAVEPASTPAREVTTHRVKNPTTVEGLELPPNW